MLTAKLLSDHAVSSTKTQKWRENYLINKRKIEDGTLL